MASNRRRHRRFWKSRRATHSGLRPRFEVLEDRLALATVSWDGGGGDTNWNNPLNWNKPGVPDPNSLPGAADEALIGAGFASLTISTSGNVAISKLTSSASLAIPAGDFTVATSSTINNPVHVSGTGKLTMSGTLS